MKLASCDFCDPKGERPRGDLLMTTIDGRAYDICQKCKEKREKLLEGKGVLVGTGSFRWTGSGIYSGTTPATGITSVPGYTNTTTMTMPLGAALLKNATGN